MLSTARPKTITVIIAMLLVLAVVSAVSSFTSPVGFGAATRPGVNAARPVGTPPAGGNFTAPGVRPGQGNNGNFQGQVRSANAGGFNLFSIARTLGLGGPAMLYINLGLSITGIALLLASAYGVWKSKRWGLNLGTLLGVIFLLGALPGLFSIGGRNINWLRTGLTILSAAAALPILALSFLPSVRDYFPRAAPKQRAR